MSFVGQPANSNDETQWLQDFTLCVIAEFYEKHPNVIEDFVGAIAQLPIPGVDENLLLLEFDARIPDPNSVLMQTVRIPNGLIDHLLGVTMVFTVHTTSHDAAQHVFQMIEEPDLVGVTNACCTYLATEIVEWLKENPPSL